MSSTITYFTPKEFKKILNEEILNTYYYQTPAGVLQLYYCSLGLWRAHYVDILEKNIDFLETPNLTNIVLVGTQFQCKVWRQLFTIPLVQLPRTIILQLLLAIPKHIALLQML